MDNALFGDEIVDAKKLADAFREFLKENEFTHYSVPGNEHEYKKTKGVLMHYKISWAGDPELNLVKWAATNEEAEGILIHYKKYLSVPLIVILNVIAGTIA